MATASKGQSWRITHVARHLGVSRQRAQQLAHADRLPPPVSVDAVGPSWDPDDIRQWAERWARERRGAASVRNFAAEARRVRVRMLVFAGSETHERIHE